jgi:hypothetical protein
MRNGARAASRERRLDQERDAACDILLRAAHGEVESGGLDSVHEGAQEGAASAAIFANDPGLFIEPVGTG